MPFKSLRQKRKEREEKAKMKELMKKLRKSKLEEICGEDKELYEVLSNTLLLNPSQLKNEGIESLLEKAKNYERSNEEGRARIAYHAAGGLALYLGDLGLVRECFKKCEEKSSSKMREIYKFFSNEENAKRALKIAQEYYKKVKPYS